MRAKDRSLGYDYRPDGQFLIRVECVECGEQFDVHAMANHTVLCAACKQVAIWQAQEKREREDREQWLQEVARLRPLITANQVETNKSITPRAFWYLLSVAMLTALALAWRLGLL